MLIRNLSINISPSHKHNFKIGTTLILLSLPSTEWKSDTVKFTNFTLREVFRLLLNIMRWAYGGLVRLKTWLSFCWRCQFMLLDFDQGHFLIGVNTQEASSLQHTHHAFLIGYLSHEMRDIREGSHWTAVWWYTTRFCLIVLPDAQVGKVSFS